MLSLTTPLFFIKKKKKNNPPLLLLLYPLIHLISLQWIEFTGHGEYHLSHKTDGFYLPPHPSSPKYSVELRHISPIFLTHKLRRFHQLKPGETQLYIKKKKKQERLLHSI